MTIFAFAGSPAWRPTDQDAAMMRRRSVHVRDGAGTSETANRKRVALLRFSTFPAMSIFKKIQRNSRRVPTLRCAQAVADLFEARSEALLKSLESYRAPAVRKASYGMTSAPA
ncbi:hypothetical protein XH97_01310 [Bradyrhizobium sp. CCBAU 53380]|nr:hypothetical protein [Bradyrhizobium sp. CCBAU 53380]